MTAIVTIATTIAGALALGVGVGAVAPAVVAAVAGGLLTATVTATKRRTPGGRALGSVLAVIAAIAMTGAIGLAVVAGPLDAGVPYRVGVVVAVGLAAFGATATLTGAVGDGAVRSAIPVAVLTALPIALVAAAYSEPVRAGWADATGTGAIGDGRLALERLVSPEGTVVGLVTFVALCVGLLWATYVVLPRLPIPELMPRDQRSAVRKRISRVAALAGKYGVIVPLAGILGAGLFNLVRTSGVPYADDAHVDDAIAIGETAADSIAMSSTLRLGILGAVALLWLLWLLSKLPGVHRLRHSSLLAWAPVLSGGLVVTLVVTLGYPIGFDRRLRPELETLAAEGTPIELPGLGGGVPPGELLDVLAPPTGIAIASVAVAAIVGTIVALLFAVWLTGFVRLLPTRGAPGSLGAAALVVGAVFAAADGASALLVSAVVACAIVAWDAGVYGVSITEELGRDVTGRQPALVHTTGAVAVGGVGVGIALLLNRLAGTVTVGTGITVAASLTLALLAVFVALKRRAKIASRSDDGGRRSARKTSDGRNGTPAGARNEDPTTAKSENSSPAPETLPPTADVNTTTIPVLEAGEARNLRAAGFETIGDLRDATVDELAADGSIGRETARQVTSTLGIDVDDGRAGSQSADSGADDDSDADSGDGDDRVPNLDPDRAIDGNVISDVNEYEAKSLRGAGFETVRDLRTASVDEIAAVDGVHETKATAIESAVRRPGGAASRNRETATKSDRSERDEQETESDFGSEATNSGSRATAPAGSESEETPTATKRPVLVFLDGIPYGICATIVGVLGMYGFVSVQYPTPNLMELLMGYGGSHLFVRFQLGATTQFSYQALEPSLAIIPATVLTVTGYLYARRVGSTAPDRFVAVISGIAGGYAGVLALATAIGYAAEMESLRLEQYVETTLSAGFAGTLFAIVFAGLGAVIAARSRTR